MTTKSNNNKEQQQQRATTTKSNNNKEQQPLVSVVMPCFNDGAYIHYAIESIKAQTYKNIELIVIDDGSDDPKTLDIINKIGHDKIMVLHTNHVFPAAARNYGIEASSGKYILPLDADDAIEAQYIQRAVSIMETCQDVGIVYCHADLFGERVGMWDLPEYSLDNEIVDNCIFVTALFRKDDWKRVGGFCEKFVHGIEDYDFWLSILELNRTVVQMPEVFFHYRIKQKSRTFYFVSDCEKTQDAYLMLYRRHRRFYLNNIDLYCTMLRKNLINYSFALRKTQQLSGQKEEPILVWWNSFKIKHTLMSKILKKIFFAFKRTHNFMKG